LTIKSAYFSLSLKLFHRDSETSMLLYWAIPHEIGGAFGLILGMVEILSDTQFSWKYSLKGEECPNLSPKKVGVPYFFGTFWKWVPNLKMIISLVYIKISTWNLFFSEIFGNYWKMLSRCETTNDYESLQTGSSRVNFFRKVMENIVRVRDDESLQTGS